MLISVHERRPRLRWVERPIPVLEPMPPRKTGPDLLAVVSVVLGCVLIMLLVLLVRGGR